MAKKKVKFSAKESRQAAEALSSLMKQRLEQYEPESPRMRRTLHEIGNILRNRMILNATTQRIVDTGALRASIQYAVSGNTVHAGSFGVRYARFHEFGANLPPNAVRAMFANMNKRTRKARHVSKGVFSGSPKTGGKLKPRPFVLRALKQEQARIRSVLANYNSMP